MASPKARCWRGRNQSRSRIFPRPFNPARQAPRSPHALGFLRGGLFTVWNITILVKSGQLTHLAILSSNMPARSEGRVVTVIGHENGSQTEHTFHAEAIATWSRSKPKPTRVPTSAATTLAEPAGYPSDGNVLGQCHGRRRMRCIPAPCESLRASPGLLTSTLLCALRLRTPKPSQPSANDFHSVQIVLPPTNLHLPVFDIVRNLYI